MLIEAYDTIERNVGSGDYNFYSDIDCSELYHAYINSKLRGLDKIDFHFMLLLDRVSEVVGAMRKHGVSEFTISCPQEGLQSVLAELDANDCIIYGVCAVKSGQRFRDANGEVAPICWDALLIRVV